jgi:hypothetical protein
MRVEFTESDALLANPGMGWQTFGHFADDDPALAGLPSGVAYFRYYWADLEPADGRFDWDRIDGHVARAQAAGQRLAFRVMCLGTGQQTYGSPRWLREAGCGGFEYAYGHPRLWPKDAPPAESLEVPFGGADGQPVHRCWAPDFDDPIFREKHGRLLAEMGSRYNGHPGVDLVDVGSVGLWGEWHMSGTGHTLPSPEARQWVRETYRQAFPGQPLVYLIADAEGLRGCVEQGVGWRADCLGDMGGFRDDWNHMDDFYRPQLHKCGAQDAWKRAPVAWESCWDARKWVAEGWDCRFIFDYALDLHGSYLNNKSAPLPEGIRPEVERFLKRLGYRLVPRWVEHPDEQRARERLIVKMGWENAGVAPPYSDWLIAFRLRPAAGGEPHVLISENSVRGWLPGAATEREDLPLPVNVAPGRYALDLAVVDPAGRQPALRLAFNAPADGLWYQISELAVV